MKFKKNLFLILILWLFNGCTGTEYAKQESIFIVFKTPIFKYADLGFIYRSPERLKIELYSNAQAVMALKIGKEKICISLFECMDKKSFNKRVLSHYYPEDILMHIFREEKIFSGQNSIKTRNGFTQKLSRAGEYDINYQVFNKQIVFHDTINAIVIKVKRLK
ncbi:Putative lipoprotein [hydrothermal vent metagenome]|uniref:Putative lipoprotein n=1 Tax=hydrothermal vent metagenome TaxID=652676 RepID=A0A1W1C033_9ZZZZ